jgi:hypothetical protein
MGVADLVRDAERPESIPGVQALAITESLPLDRRVGTLRSSLNAGR